MTQPAEHEWTVRVWSTVAVILGGTVALGGLFAIYTWFTLAQPSLEREVRSPPGQVLAREYRYYTDWNFDPAYGLEITLASAAIPWAWLSNGETVLRASCNDLALSWENAQRLRIDGEFCGNIRQRDQGWRDLTIEYHLRP